MLQLVVTPSFVFDIGAAEVLELIFKVLLIAVSVLYILFAILILREISLMRRAVAVPNTGVVLLIGFVHLVLAILLFLFFLLIL